MSPGFTAPIGSFTINLKISDQANNPDIMYPILVTVVDRPPTFDSLPLQQPVIFYASNVGTFTVSYSDPDGAYVTLSLLTPLPQFLTCDTHDSYGCFMFDPTAAPQTGQEITGTIEIEITDGRNVISETVSWVVKPASSVAMIYEALLSNLGAPVFTEDLAETLNVTAGTKRAELLPDVKDPDNLDKWTVTVGRYGTATAFV
jgi:hypothetical protein